MHRPRHSAPGKYVGAFHRRCIFPLCDVIERRACELWLCLGWKGQSLEGGREGGRGGDGMGWEGRGGEGRGEEGREGRGGREGEEE